MYRSSYDRRTFRQDRHDPDKWNELFRLLRKEGLIARQNFSCCGGCAGYELAEEYAAARKAGKGQKIKGVVFYHRQDADTLRRTGATYVRFGKILSYGDTPPNADGSPRKPQFETPLSDVEVGEIMKRCLDQVGLEYSWNGDPSQCFYIGEGAKEKSA